MKHFLYSLAAFLFIISCENTSAQSFPNPATLATGQGSPGSLDPLWLVSQWYSTSPPNPMGLSYTAALINNNCAPGSWVDPTTLPPPTNNGNWITGTSSPCAGNTNDGYLYFRLPLNLPTDCNGNSVATAGNYTLYLSGYVDNQITDIYVNGTSTGISGGGFTPGSQLNITLPGPWQPGMNYVDVLVYNFPNGGNANPYGLLLVANSAASTIADGDGDGVVDINDQCPCASGPGPSGCPPANITGNTTFCVGGSTTLTATGGGTYHWSDNSTADNITVNPLVNTTYSVTTTSSTGFTSSASINVVVNQPPAASISPASVAICNGQSTTLTASGGTGYLWSTTAGTAAITVSPATQTTYTVTVTDANTCTAVASRTVNVNPLPTATINPASVAICNGQSTTLTASGGTGYLWSTAAGTAAITVSPTTLTTYSVTVTDANTCSASASRSVTVNTLPIPAISPASVAICNGQNTTLTASGGTGYLWSTTAGTAAITVSPTTLTTYSVTVTDANTCSASASRSVTVNALPIPAINPASVAICNGQSTTLTASGGTGYLWSTTAGTAAITVSPTTTTSYSVTVTDANTCSASASRSVTVNQLPIPAINPASVAICNGQSTTLTASGGTGYLWSTTAGTAAITVSPTTTASYSVTVTDANTCSASVSRSVTVNQLPIPAINPASVAICSGQSTTLTASGGTGYLWSTTAGTAAITVSPTTLTTYSVTVTDANTCSASASRSVTVNALPIPAINPASVAICNGQSTTLTASGGTGYLWNTTAGTAAITVSPTNTTSYSVTVTDANTCSASVSRSVTVNQLPIPAINPASVAICNGQSTTLTASGGTGYLWNTTAGTAAITVSPATASTYSVTVTDANTCSASASATVSVNPLPSPSITMIPPTICVGSSSTLTASGGTGYLWSTSAGTAAITVSPATTTSYSVTVTDANSCSATTSASVSVNSLPIPAINPAAPSICAGTSTTLTASGGSSYLWSNTDATAATTVSPGGNTSYTVTVTDVNTCSASLSVAVNVNPLPVAAINPSNPSICTGTSTTLTASGGTSYLWSNTDVTAASTVSPTTATSYSVTVTDANTCSASASVTVSVNASPSPSITMTPPAICVGSSSTLTASGGVSYLWSNTDATASTTVSPTANTTYSVTVTDANTCSATTSATVTVNQLPIAAINPPAPSICTGNSTMLTASGGTGYLWSNTDATAATTVSPTLTASYSVTVTDANTCTASASVSVTVNSLPVPAITPVSVSICTGSSTTLTASGGVSYLWSNSDNTAATTVSPSGNTTYSVTVTDANTCSASVSSSVTVNPVPVASISPSASQICIGASTTLTASGGVSYVWNVGGSSQAPTMSPTSTTTYVVTVTDANNCTGSTSQTITVVPAMTFSTTKTDVSCNGGSDGAVDLTVSSGLSPYGYQWTPSGTVQDPTGLTAGSYSVVVTDNAGCTATTGVTITEPGSMAIIPTLVKPTCVTKGNDGSISLTIVGGISPYQYFWSNNDNTSSLQNLGPDTYEVTVSDQHGCSATASFPLAYVYDFTIQASSDVTINLAESTMIGYTVTGNSGTLASLWTPGSALSCTDCDAPVAAPNVSTQYRITVKNDAGCTATDTTTVFVVPDYSIYIPNAFTPNGDGKNDVFEMFGNKKALKFVEVEVFDRWGETVYKSNDIDFAWDGTFRGKYLEPGPFVWQVNFAFIDGHSPDVKKGSLTLIR